MIFMKSDEGELSEATIRDIEKSGRDQSWQDTINEGSKANTGDQMTVSQELQLLRRLYDDVVDYALCRSVLHFQ